MGTRPVISTTLLTHNRISLTKRAVDAYFASTKVPFELIVVDNASSDGTRQYLESLKAQHPQQVKLVLRDQNYPIGKAFNLGFSQSSGEYLHRMDNDMIHHEGWDTRVLQCFQVFPGLGQISPLKFINDYITQIHPVDADFAIAYSIRNAPGGSAVIPRSLWENGLRLRENPFIPGVICEDYWMSQDIARMGYDFAWFATDQYCTNPGHNPHEMVTDIDYYIKSYALRGNLPLLAKRLTPTGFDLWKYLQEHPLTYPTGLGVRRGINTLVSRATLAWRDRIDAWKTDKRCRPRKQAKALRISVLITEHADASITLATVRHFASQGIKVHALKKDQSPEDALHALESRSDWIIRIGAGQIITPTSIGQSLRAGVESADSAGFNCIAVSGLENVCLIKCRSGIFYFGGKSVSPSSNARLFPSLFQLS